jgi:VWFA-related protein
MTKRPIIATFLVCILAAFAQQLPPKTDPPPPPQKLNGVLVPNSGLKISTTTQLVIETVFVKDKKGNPVKMCTGTATATADTMCLKKSDFIVAEDGKPYDIKFFDYEELSETSTVDPNVDIESKLEKKKEEVKPAEPATKSLTANQISPEKPGDLKYKDRRLLVLFFDMTAMPIPDQLRAQKEAQKFLKEKMTPSDLVAIMTFSSDVNVIQDFTDDRDLLSKDIKNLTVGSGQGFDEATSDDSTSDTGAAFVEDDTEFNIFNTDRQLTALETAVKLLGSLNEKKALVYFASGITKNGFDNDAQLRATINAAIRANVAFYTVDARGLVANAPLGDATKTSPGGSGMYSGSSARAAQSNFQGQQETLSTLAFDTGGKPLLDNNELSAGIVQAQKDVSSYYIIGYYSTNEKMDGAFRKVDIKLKPTVTLSGKLAALDYRHGYYANRSWNKFTSTDKERQLTEALMLSDPVTDISMVVEYDFFRLAKDRYFVPISLKIPGSELVLAKGRGAEKTVIDFIGQVTDATTKKVVQNVRDIADIKLSGTTATELAKRPIAYDTGFSLAPGKYQLKLLARENETGKMGTYQHDFIVPDLTAQQTSLPISSVILSSQRTLLSEAVFNAEKDKKLLTLNPLYQDGKQMVPSITRVFNRNQELYVYLEAYEPLATTTEPIVATVAFYRNGVKAFQTDPLQVTDGLNPKTKAVPLRFSLSMKDLRVGNYTCQVSVFDPSAQKFNIWRQPVTVVQSAAAAAAGTPQQ